MKNSNIEWFAKIPKECSTFTELKTITDKTNPAILVCEHDCKMKELFGSDRMKTYRGIPIVYLEDYADIEN